MQGEVLKVVDDAMIIRFWPTTASGRGERWRWRYTWACTRCGIMGGFQRHAGNAEYAARMHAAGRKHRTFNT